MKNKKSLLLIPIGIILVLIVIGCANKTDDKDIRDLYTLTQNDDNTYSFTFADLYGNIILEEENAAREPGVNNISDNVYEIIIQEGTGLSTKRVVYYDAADSKVSETFCYVPAAQGNYVVCADYEDGKHFVVIQNIFDKSAYKKTNFKTFTCCCSFCSWLQN